MGRSRMRATVMVTVPHVEGLPLEEAQRRVAMAGLVALVEVEPVRGAIPRTDQVRRQHPEPGVRRRRRDLVVLGFHDDGGATSGARRPPGPPPVLFERLLPSDRDEA